MAGRAEDRCGAWHRFRLVRMGKANPKTGERARLRIRKAQCDGCLRKKPKRSQRGPLSQNLPNTPPCCYPARASCGLLEPCGEAPEPDTLLRRDGRHGNPESVAAAAGTGEIRNADSDPLGRPPSGYYRSTSYRVLLRSIHCVAGLSRLAEGSIVDTTRSGHGNLGRWKKPPGRYNRQCGRCTPQSRRPAIASSS
jgi:hypothetical protein